MTSLHSCNESTCLLLSLNEKVLFLSVEHQGIPDISNFGDVAKYTYSELTGPLCTVDVNVSLPSDAYLQ